MPRLEPSHDTSSAKNSYKSPVVCKCNRKKLTVIMRRGASIGLWVCQPRHLHRTESSTRSAALAHRLLPRGASTVRTRVHTSVTRQSHGGVGARRQMPSGAAK
eukprot:2942171-Prymnesium_polylepis.3